MAATITVSEAVQNYLRQVRETHDCAQSDYEEESERRDNLWHLLTKEERDQANAIVEIVFGDTI